MYRNAPDGSRDFSLLRLIARFTAGLSQLAVMGLTVLTLMLAVPLAGVTADWLVKQRETTKSGVRSFVSKESDSAASNCLGTACGMATLPMTTYRQVGGTNSTAVTARIRWPSPISVSASPGAYFEWAAGQDRISSVVERGRQPATQLSDSAAQGSANDSYALLLANEVQKDGKRGPINVDAEGFVSSWTLDGEQALGRSTAWAPADTGGVNDATQQAANDRRHQWQGMKVHSFQFQPVPTSVEVDILQVEGVNPITAGDVMAFDWQGTGVLDGQFQQVVPSRSMLGVVTTSQDMGQNLRLIVHIPRSSLYSGGGHWLWQRLRAVPVGAPALTPEVRAVFFKPPDKLGVAPAWERMERIFQKLPLVEILRAPLSATDPLCTEPVALSHSCVWVALHGIAVPVQVTVQILADGYVAVTERAVFAGKAIRSADWALMPREFRQSYGYPSGLGPELTRKVLVGSQLLLSPQPWLKAGLPVSAASPQVSSKP
jgi:hypothetical protein